MNKEEAIKVYKELINERIKEAFEFFAPELKESEDERIRKELINFFKNHMDSVYEEISDNNVVIAWLEKQGEHKEIDYGKELKKCKDNPLYFFDKYVKIKLKEQYPAWSEDDEQQMKSCFDFLDNISCGDDSELNDCRNWLKYIKERMKGENE